jgi:hypothetical protein
MKGPQRDLRVRLTDALHGAKTPDVTGRHKGHFQPGTGGPEGPLWLTAQNAAGADGSASVEAATATS